MHVSGAARLKRVQVGVGVAVAVAGQGWGLGARGKLASLASSLRPSRFIA